MYIIDLGPIYLGLPLWVGRSVARSVGRSFGESVGRSVGRPIGRSVGRSVGRSMVGRPENRPADSSTRMPPSGWNCRRGLSLQMDIKIDSKWTPNESKMTQK